MIRVDGICIFLYTYCTSFRIGYLAQSATANIGLVQYQVKKFCYKKVKKVLNKLPVERNEEWKNNHDQIKLCLQSQTTEKKGRWKTTRATTTFINVDEEMGSFCRLWCWRSSLSLLSPTSSSTSSRLPKWITQTITYVLGRSRLISNVKGGVDLYKTWCGS